jgi:GAF domain-containing protein
VDAEKLAGTFVRLADTLVEDFDVHDLLQTLAARCVDLFDVGAAGLLLADEHGRLQVVVSSNERTRLLELFQVQNDEGPCLDCFRTGGPVKVDDLAMAQHRWPAFVPHAVAEGFGSVVALPMRLRGEAIGALNLFGGPDSTPFTDRRLAIAQALADVATIAILQERLARNRDLLATQLQVALNSRIAIEQAKGALATLLQIGLDEAFHLIREHARSSRRHLVEVARDVVERRGDIDWAELRRTQQRDRRGGQTRGRGQQT